MTAFKRDEMETMLQDAQWAMTQAQEWADALAGPIEDVQLRLRVIRAFRVVHLTDNPTVGSSALNELIDSLGEAATSYLARHEDDLLGNAALLIDVDAAAKP